MVLVYIEGFLLSYYLNCCESLSFPWFYLNLGWTFSGIIELIMRWREALKLNDTVCEK